MILYWLFLPYYFSHIISYIIPYIISPTQLFILQDEFTQIVENIRTQHLVNSLKKFFISLHHFLPVRKILGTDFFNNKRGNNRSNSATIFQFISLHKSTPSKCHAFQSTHYTAPHTFLPSKEK